jgi:hypothetical protein
MELLLNAQEWNERDRRRIKMAEMTTLTPYVEYILSDMKINTEMHETVSSMKEVNTSLHMRTDATSRYIET